MHWQSSDHEYPPKDGNEEGRFTADFVLIGAFDGLWWRRRRFIRTRTRTCTRTCACACACTGDRRAGGPVGATAWCIPGAWPSCPTARLLVTERPGRLRIVGADGRIGAPLTGLPPVAYGGQGGLLDVITDRDFARNRTLHFCYSEPGLGGNSTALASARLSEDRSALEDLRVVFSQKPKVGSRLHFGCRIVQAGDGSLFLTLGDRYHAHGGRADAGQPPRQGGAHPQGRQRAARQPLRGPGRRPARDLEHWPPQPAGR